MKNRGLNYMTLVVFSPILVLTGVLGLVLPDGPMSNASAYNVFHIVFGVVGVAIVMLRKESLIRAFNVGFGCIDLYQAVASFAGWFPISYFQWKTADDVLHLIIGAALVMIGVLGKR